MKRKTGRSAGRGPASPSDLDLRTVFGTLVGQVPRRWRALIDARLKEYGLTEATWRPLLHVSKFEAPPRQTDLAESLAIEGPSLVRLLDTLERDGYILRCTDSDRRTKTIRLTARGESLQRRIATVVDETRDQVLAGVAPRQLAAAIDVLEQVQRSIRTLEETDLPSRRSRRKS